MSQGGTRKAKPMGASFYQQVYLMPRCPGGDGGDGDDGDESLLLWTVCL